MVLVYNKDKKFLIHLYFVINLPTLARLLGRSS